MKLSLIWQLWPLVRSQPVPLHAMQMPQSTLKQAGFHIKQVELVGDNQRRCKFSCRDRKGRGEHELIRQCFWIVLTSAYRNAIRPAPRRRKTATRWRCLKKKREKALKPLEVPKVRHTSWDIKRRRVTHPACLKSSIWKADKRAAAHYTERWKHPEEEKAHTYCRNVFEHNHHIRMCFTHSDHNCNKQDIFSGDI